MLARPSHFVVVLACFSLYAWFSSLKCYACERNNSRARLDKPNTVNLSLLASSPSPLHIASSLRRPTLRASVLLSLPLSANLRRLSTALVFLPRMDPPTPQGPGEDAGSLSGLLGRRSKNRNKKGLALTAEATKPGTLSGASAVDLLKAPAPPVPSRPQPIQVTGSSRSKRNSVISLDSADTVSPQLPTTPSLSSSSTSSRSYHNQLNEQLASLELGVEFRIDLRNEDLEVLDELGSGNGGTVSRVLHVPTKAVMAKKVRSASFL